MTNYSCQTHTELKYVVYYGPAKMSDRKHKSFFSLTEASEFFREKSKTCHVSVYAEETTKTVKIQKIT